MREHLGSLVRGVVKSGNINIRELDTNSREETVTSFKEAIAGQCRIWTTDLEDRLCRRVGITDPSHNN